MTALILQARLDSSRLPEKSMLPLGGRPLVFRVMEAFRFCPWQLKILACPEDSVSSFAPLAEEAGFILVAGSREDVLARYCLAVSQPAISQSAVRQPAVSQLADSEPRIEPGIGIDRIIRATADNPFVFADAAITLAADAEAQLADYAAYCGLPYGAGVESINTQALLRAGKEAETAEEREHVCPYLYNHPELFRLHRPAAPSRWQAPELRLTIDTREDYEKALILYEQLLSLPPQERNLGENIIATCKRIFPREA